MINLEDMEISIINLKDIFGNEFALEKIYNNI